MQKVNHRIFVQFVTFLLICISSTSTAQKINEVYIDSLTYQQYLVGDWDGIIATQKIASANQIDFKYLQQRTGYAYFMKYQYYKSIGHYEQALALDPEDEITKLYLYYNGLYSGNNSFARYYAGKLSEEYKHHINQKTFRPLDEIDFEYNYKIAEEETRENAHYKRVGLNSQLGYQLNLYQTISTFSQLTDYVSLNTQNEYFGILSWNPSARTTLAGAYHYTGTRITQDPDTFNYPGNMFFGKINHKFKRFDLSLTGSTYSNDWVDAGQVGIHLGIGFAGKNNMYFKSSYYRLQETGSDYSYNRGIFKQTGGMMLFNRLWTEASVTMGNLNNFVDNDGLYIYNSYDQTTFRSGLTLFGYITPKIGLLLNYTYDKKLIYQFDKYYNQHSITGGISWKI